MRSRRGAARELLDRSLSVMRELRLEWVEARLCPHIATVEHLVGDRAGAAARLAGAYEGLAAMGALSQGALLLARLAAYAVDERDADEALELSRRSLAIALPDDTLTQVEGRAAAARAHALRGEHRKALVHARGAVRRALRTDEPVLRATAHIAFADALVAAGDRDGAASSLRDALAEAEAKGAAALARRVRRRLGPAGG
jgi:tetratricopeptide (TPR) repeat protein